MAEDEQASRRTAMPMAPSGSRIIIYRRVRAQQQLLHMGTMPAAPPGSMDFQPRINNNQSEVSMIQRAVADMDGACARFNIACARLENACASFQNACASMSMAAERRNNNLVASMNMAAQSMTNLVAAMRQREMGAPAQAAQFQTNQGGVRTVGPFNVNRRNTPELPTQGARTRDALRVATGGPGAASFKRTTNRHAQVKNKTGRRSRSA